VTELGATGAAAEIALGLLSVAILLASWRLLRGPSLADRVVALDAIAAAIVAAAVVLAVRTGQPVFVDVALAVALVAFLGTVALARAVERGDAS
jgi:multisubunit Na+/H+ antiporter MnhF subunit